MRGRMSRLTEGDVELAVLTAGIVLIIAILAAV